MAVANNGRTVAYGAIWMIRMVLASIYAVLEFIYFAVPANLAATELRRMLLWSPKTDNVRVIAKKWLGPEA